MGNLEVVPAGLMHGALHIEMPHFLNAIMRRSCIETAAERTMNPAVDHFCLSELTPCPRLKNGRLFEQIDDEITVSIASIVGVHF